MRALSALLLVASVAAQPSNHLKEYFQKVANDAKFSANDQQLMDIGEEVATLPASQISEAIPILQEVLAAGGAAQRGAVVLVLLSIAWRSDGTSLLANAVPDVVRSLRDPDIGVARVAGFILFNLYPRPIESVLPSVLKYVSDDRANGEMRAGLVGLLAEYSPQDPQVIAVITEYMHADHSVPERDAALDGIANAQTRGDYSPALVSLIIEAVENDPKTRFTSVQALGRCGRNAAEVAIPVLSKIAHDDRETPEIRRMAEGAIDYIHRSAR